ncbi:MAG TPA: DUF1236 domain-containing protein [Rhizobiaceae bacterium]|nr:DUF1236 domain-containing protein [Rhizobiaceae bacterium]
MLDDLRRLTGKFGTTDSPRTFGHRKGHNPRRWTMKSIIIKSAVILGLGIAPGAVLAQSGSTQPGAQSGTGSVSGQSDAQQPQSGTMPKDAQGGMTAGAGSGNLTGSDTQTGGASSGGGGTLSQPGAADSGQQEGAGSGSRAERESSGASGTQTQSGAANSGQEQGTGSAAESRQRSGEDMNQESTQAQQGRSTESGVSGETTGSINVTTEQRTEIRQIITEEKVEPVRSVEFEVTVGTAVPKTVEVHTLPPRIVKLVPAYEGYKYFVLADGRIVIVDPNSMEIVYIVTA